MESQKTQSFAKGSCSYQFFSLTIRVVEGYFLVQAIMEGCERRRSGSLALRLSRLSLYYEQPLFGGWRPTYSFHPAYAVGTQGLNPIPSRYIPHQDSSPTPYLDVI